MSKRLRSGERSESSSVWQSFKSYGVLRDLAAEKLGLLRVSDESGDGYLYPAKRFERLSVTPRLARALAAR